MTFIFVRSTFVHARDAPIGGSQRRASSAPVAGAAVCRPEDEPVFVFDADAASASARWRRAGPSSGASPQPPSLDVAKTPTPRASEASTTTGPSIGMSPCAGGEEEWRTTAMMRNVPRALTRDALLSLIKDEGFTTEVDFVYLPIDFRSGVNTGFAFVNFCTPEAAQEFRRHFWRFSRWPVESGLVCNVSWARDDQQGLAANLERYRNSSVMHRKVADESRPMLLANGVRVPFPKPTRRLWAPHSRFGARAENGRQ